ncbi:unnamed protein product [Spirodela intermedia]|uniref:Uncharacterized protein n=1 Tax=Spirodela intermedia TaxID=51605 RepID=A0ABN7E888_SPIIN|nr:unnamed protein product [Spirodela intermedia]
MASSATVLASFRSHSHLRRAEQDLRRISANPGLLIRFCGSGGCIHRKVPDQSRVVVAGKSRLDIFACPICYKPLIRKGVGVVHQVAIYRSGFKCERCNKPFSSRNTYLDLTVTSGIREYNEYKPSGTEMFSFSRNGFPGLEEEFKMAQEYFEHVAGGLLLDIRSGSGLFSRKFSAKSRTFSKVIALNFSKNMLRQCYEFIFNVLYLFSNLLKGFVKTLPLSTTIDLGKSLITGSSAHLVCSQEVVTRLLVDCPLPYDSLFVDQLEMIYSMNLQSFYHESFSNFSNNALQIALMRFSPMI